MRHLPAAAMAAVALLFVASVRAETPAFSPATAQKIDAAIQDTLKRTDTPSASVAVVKDGRIVYARAFGWADIAAHRAATPETRYEIASVSKEVTAAGVLLLVQDGRLSLDDHVSRWFPQLTDADHVTVRQLLSHTSGYSDYWPQDYVMAPMLHDTTPGYILKTWGERPLDYHPGDDWQYSNTGYVIAGQIIEKVSGEPLFAYLKRRIFDPLHMAGVADADTVRAAGGVYAQGYERYALGPQRAVPREGRGWLYAMGEINATAADMARWDESLIDRSLLSASSYAAQTTEVKLNSGKGSGYGLGLFISDKGGRREWSHGGEGSGFLAENRIYPDDKVAVVVLINSFSSTAQTELADRVAGLVLAPKGPQARAERLFAGLQRGEPDRAAFTSNFNAYLSPRVVADYRATLGPLGAPTVFALSREEDRGGMKHEVYRIEAGGKALTLNAYVQPDGKVEQFLVNAAK